MGRHGLAHPFQISRRLVVKLRRAGQGLRRHAIVSSHSVGDAGTEDNSLEKGIGREAVGAVNARARALADRVETGNIARAGYIRSYAPHMVMRRRCDGEKIRLRIEACLPTGLVYVWKGLRK